MIEQIHIPFAPQLAGSVDISNQISESNFLTWVTEHWEWLLVGLIAILIIAWALGGFDKPKPVVKDEPKPTPTPNPVSIPFETPK